MRKTLFTYLGCFTVVCLLATGCQKTSLENPYTFEERAFTVLEPEDGGYAKPFADDLCVVTDESGYDGSGIDAEAAAVFDIDKEVVVYSKNAFEKMYPASITKVMTAIIAIEQGNMSDEVVVTKDAVITEAGASLCGIKPGDRVTMEQLLYGLMMPSGNDAANAIAVHIAGDLDSFYEMMNERAAALGATQTHFMNANGLNNEEHYTTAYDLYLIFNEALKLPLFREVIGTSSYTADYTDISGNPVSKTWTVGNWYMNGERTAPEGLTVIGGKTGTTKAAGYCLIMASEDQAGHDYISVVLKAASRDNLYNNMTNIITKIVN